MYKPVPGLYTPTEADKAIYKDMAICILTPCGSYETYAKFTRSIVNMVCYSWMHGLRVYLIGMSERMVVDWARNEMARNLQNHINEYTGEKFTHMLWLDDDHVFEADLACVLASHNKDMVSALYYARVGKTLPVVYVKGGEKKDKFKHYSLVVAPERLFECDAVGFGAMLMRRDVLDRVPQPWFTIDWKSGEDIAFCVKAKEHGVQIYCDGRYKLGHIGAPEIIGHQHYKKYMEDHKDELADKIKIQLGT